MAGDTTLWKAQKAVYSELTGDATLLAMVSGIFDEPPQASAFPYITIGEGTETPQDTFGKQGKDNVLTTHVWSRYNGFKEIGLIVERMNLTLDSATLSIAGYTTVHVTHSASRLFRDPDGETRHGIIEYEMTFMEL